MFVMKCPKCGSEVSPEAMFCSSCGAYLRERDLSGVPATRIRPAAASPKTELSLNLPSIDVFERLLDYFENRFGNMAFFDIKKIPTSSIEGKWSVPPIQVLSGNFKIAITEDNNETKVKINIDAGNVSLLVLGLFSVGLLLLLAVPPAWALYLMLFGFATAFFVASQWRRNNIIREINELFQAIPEFTEEQGRFIEEQEKIAWKQASTGAWAEIVIGVFLMIAGIVGLIAYVLGWVEITGLELAIILFCLTFGFSAIIHGFQRLQSIQQGGQI